MSDTAAEIRIAPRLLRNREYTEAELWVLERNFLAQLSEWAAQADERLVQRFHIGCFRRQDCDVAVLMARGRGSPPVLILDAKAYRSYLRLPNLFIPVGAKLQPPLRRDWARQTYASDSAVVTWLDGDGNGIVASQIPANDFRPLSEWISYVAPERTQLRCEEIATAAVVSPFEIKDRPAAVRLRAKPGRQPQPPWLTDIHWDGGGWRAVSKPIDETTS